MYNSFCVLSVEIFLLRFYVYKCMWAYLTTDKIVVAVGNKKIENLFYLREN